MKVALYTRVSTEDQSTERQIAELREYAKGRGWDLGEIYTENASGTNNKRKEFQAMLAAARAKKFDILLVWKLDRLSRSLRDLVTTLQELDEIGVQFVSLKDQIDLTTSAGRLMLHIVGAFAQFEADLIRERVRSGLENARRKGVVLGRPRSLSDEALDAIKELRSRGATIDTIAARLQIPRATVGRTVKVIGRK